MGKSRTRRRSGSTVSTRRWHAGRTMDEDTPWRYTVVVARTMDENRMLPSCTHYVHTHLIVVPSTYYVVVCTLCDGVQTILYSGAGSGGASRTSVEGRRIPTRAPRDDFLCRRHRAGGRGRAENCWRKMGRRRRTRRRTRRRMSIPAPPGPQGVRGQRSQRLHSAGRWPR